MNSTGNRRGSNKRVHNKNAAGGTEIVDLLKQMVSLQDQTRNRMQPEVDDVPRIRLKENRKFMTTFSYGGTNITANSTAPTIGSLYFQLNNAADYLSWTNSFDAYRIIQVNVEFVPFSIGVTGTTTTTGAIYTALDYSDASAVDANTLLQYDTCQVVNAPQYFERRIVPRTAKALYSGTFTGYGQDIRSWISSESPGVQHYGLKYSQGIASSAVTTYSVLVTMFVQFKNSK